MIHEVEVIPDATVVWTLHLFLYIAHSCNHVICHFCTGIFKSVYSLYISHAQLVFSETIKGH